MAMLKNYLKMAYRNLMRHKVFSLINVSGLALGMTCSILILLWVKDEVSFNRFHTNIDNLYRVMELQHYPGNDDLVTASGPGPLAAALEQEMPEVEQAVRITWGWNELFTYGEKALKVSGKYVDAEFFEVFSFPFLHGDPSKVLQQPNSVVISDSTALKFFGSTEEAMGKMFKINNKESYKVTGVFKNIPSNSSLQLDYAMPFNDYETKPDGQWLKNWSNNGINTFIALTPGTDIDAFNKKIELFLKKKNEGSHIDLFVQAVDDMHLYGDFRGTKVASGGITYVRLFSVVALFILVIACINFMNLATARSAKRAKEVGVRKAIGANKSALIKQFMVESVLIAFIALFLSLNLTGIILPQFNELTGKSVELDLANPELIMLLIGVALFTGIVSGSYPAFFLSSFNPAVVLKGTVKLSSRVAVFRKGLVVFQFVLSALLIVSTLVVYLQLEYIRTKNIGLNRENVLYVPMEGDLSERYESVKQELLRTPGITAVSASDQNPLMIGSSTGEIEWKGKEKDAGVLFSVMTVDHDFMETLGVQIKEGRSFSKEFGTDTAAYLVNEEAARLMNMKEPVGEWLKWDDEGHIIGVINDFHSTSMHTPMQPVIIKLDPGNSSLLYARIDGKLTANALASIEQVLKKYNPAFPFDYSFLDDDFESMYRSEMVIGKLTNYFAGIAIFISCLGLFGLALFTAEQRTKEIGVRKVLGASVASIVVMLSKDFLKLVLLANLIALPLSWYLMNNWLEDYAFRTELNWWIFVAALIATFLIAMLTLSFHAVRTAVSDPVTSLRTE